MKHALSKRFSIITGISFHPSSATDKAHVNTGQEDGKEGYGPMFPGTAGLQTFSI